VSISPLASLGRHWARLASQLHQSSGKLAGLVGLHTHPAVHLGFGTELFYGPPDGE